MNTPGSKPLDDARGAAGLALGLSLLTLAVHFVTNGRYGYFRDELYYLACGQHLSFGYVDHPPLVPWMAAASRLLLGDSLFAIRLLSAVASALVVAVVVAMTRALGGGRPAQTVAGVSVLTGASFLLAGNILSTIVFDLLWWTVALHLFVRWLRTRDGRLELWIGVVIGLGLMTKHNMAFLALGFACLLAGEAAARALGRGGAERPALATRWPWLAGLVAALLVLPHVVWQAAHGWPTIGFLRGLGRGLQHTPLRAALLEFALTVNPLTLPVAALGVALIVSRRGRPFRPLGALVAIVVAVLAAGRGKSYYFLPVYIPLLAAGGVFVERLLVGRARWLATAILAAVVLSGAALVPFALPVLRVDRLLQYSRAAGMTRWGNFTGTTQPLPAHFADMFGWPGLARDVADVYHQLPAADRSRAVIYARNFGEAAAIDFFGPRYGLPRAVSGNHSYFFWGPGDRPGDVLITIGDRLEDLRHTCAEARIALVHVDPLALPVESPVPIGVCRGLPAPLQTLWPRLRSGF